MLDLACELDGKPVQISSAGRKIIVETDSVYTVRELGRLLTANNSFRSRVNGLKSLLDSTGLQLESRVNGKTIGCIGDGIGSRFWRIFGLPVMQLHPYAIILAMASDR